VNLPKGQTWPKGKDDDNDGCIMTISSDTAQFQDIRAQCLLMDIQKKSTKYSDEKYQLEITLRTKNLLAPMVVTPPMEAVVQVNASFIGACSD
jgi:hypothetical protein